MHYNGLFLSEIEKKPVINVRGDKVGKVVDCIVSQGEVFPKLVAVEIQTEQGQRTVSVEDISLLNKRFVSLKGTLEVLRPAVLSGNELFLRRDLLDRQIVDINGAKVVRINDLKLTDINGEYRLVAVDIGFSGLLRRLGVESLARKIAGWLHVTVPGKLISWDYVEPLETELTAVKLTVPYRKVASLHPADIATIVSAVHSKERTAIFHALDNEKAAEALQEIDNAEVQASILETLGNERAADILEEMSADEAADLLNELPEEKAKELLDLMEEEDAEDVQELLEYDETTAGGLMTTEAIMLPQELTAEDTINRLRELAPDAETIYYLYVVDEYEHLVGVLSLRELIIAPPDTRLSQIMHTKVIKVKADANQDEVARVMRKYGLLAVPVVDDEKHLLGIVTIDDIVEAVFPQRPRLLLHAWKRL